jgi:hypothetical protein
MARGKGEWCPPEELNPNPPGRDAPHMGTTRRSDTFGNPGTNTNMRGMGDRGGGEGKAKARGDGWNNKNGNLPRTT